MIWVTGSECSVSHSIDPLWWQFYLLGVSEGGPSSYLRLTSSRFPTLAAAVSLDRETTPRLANNLVKTSVGLVDCIEHFEQFCVNSVKIWWYIICVIFTFGLCVLFIFFSLFVVQALSIFCSAHLTLVLYAPQVTIVTDSAGNGPKFSY